MPAAHVAWRGDGVYARTGGARPRAPRRPRTRAPRCRECALLLKGLRTITEQDCKRETSLNVWGAAGRLGGWAVREPRRCTRRTHPPRRSPHTPQPRADAPNQKAYLRTPVSTPVTVRLLLLSKRRIGHMIHEPLSHVAHESISRSPRAGAAVTRCARIGPELRPPRAVGAVAGESRDAAYIARGYRTLRRGPLSTSRDGPVPAGPDPPRAGDPDRRAV